MLSRWLPPAVKDGMDFDAYDSAADMPYDIPNMHVEYIREEPPAVPTGFWRGVGPSQWAAPERGSAGRLRQREAPVLNHPPGGRGRRAGQRFGARRDFGAVG